MTPEFNEIVNHVFDLEGGIADDPNDRGGYTNMGITLPFLSQYLGRPATRDDITNLTKHQAKDAYYKNIWLGMRIESYPSWARPVMFSAVCGSMVLYYRMVRQIQEIVGTPIDGAWGPASMRAAEKAAQESSEARLANRLALALGEEYMKICSADPSQRIYAAGWYRRAYELSRLSADADNRGVHATIFQRMSNIARRITNEDPLPVYKGLVRRYNLDADFAPVVPAKPLGDPVRPVEPPAPPVAPAAPAPASPPTSLRDRLREKLKGWGLGR
jgi:lysozyme family protein